MPNQLPTFHDGCYCFRDAEAELARAAGQPVRCGGGRPCSCHCADMYHPMPEMTPVSHKRPRSSCGCYCAILHAASAAAAAAVTKMRRCCGGDCRCPPGLCRCPQEAVPVDTYACGALTEAISQRVATALQMDPTPPPPEFNALETFQPAGSIAEPPEVAAVWQQAMNGFLTGANSAVAYPNAGVGSSQPDLTNRQQLPDDIAPLQFVGTPPRQGCGAAAGKPPVATINPSPSFALTSAELENAIAGVPGLTPARSCCGGSQSKTPSPNTAIATNPGIAASELDTSVAELPNLIPPRPSGCCGGGSSRESLPHSTAVLSTTVGLNSAAVVSSVPDLSSKVPKPRTTFCCGGASSSSAAPAQSTEVANVVTTQTRCGNSSQQSITSAPTSPAVSRSTRGKSFPTSAQSSRSEPTNERDRIFGCNLCDAAFKFKQNRDRHINEVHHGLRPHECDYPGCGSAFKNLSGLKQHKKTVHEKARPFQCELCDRAFGQRNHLSQHILVVHEKVKRYPCNFCDMAFSNVGNRTQHTKRRHQNELQRKENQPEKLNENTT